MRKSTGDQPNPDMRDWRFAYGLRPRRVHRCCDCGAEYVRVGPRVRCQCCQRLARSRYHAAYWRRRAIVAAWVRVIGQAVDEARA